MAFFLFLPKLKNPKLVDLHLLSFWTRVRLPPSPVLIFILNLCTRGGEHAQGFSLVNTNKNGKALI